MLKILERAKTLGCSAVHLPLLLQRKPPGKMPSASQGWSSLEKTWAPEAHRKNMPSGQAEVGRERGRSLRQPHPLGAAGASVRARLLTRVLVLQSLQRHYHLGLHCVSPGRSWPVRAARPPAAPSCLHVTPVGLFASHPPCKWIGTVPTGNCVLVST